MFNWDLSIALSQYYVNSTHTLYVLTVCSSLILTVKRTVGPPFPQRTFVRRVRGEDVPWPEHNILGIRVRLLHPVRVSPHRVADVCAFVASCSLCSTPHLGATSAAAELILYLSYTHVPLIMQHHAYAQTCFRISAETHTRTSAH